MVRPLNVLGVLRGLKAGAGGEHERGDELPFRKGVWGISPEKIFIFKMSVEAIFMYFESMFACETRLIVQTFHVAVFKRKGVRGISP